MHSKQLVTVRGMKGISTTLQESQNKRMSIARLYVLISGFDIVIYHIGYLGGNILQKYTLECICTFLPSTFLSIERTNMAVSLQCKGIELYVAYNIVFLKLFNFFSNNSKIV